MTKLNVLLFLALVASALALVYYQHEGRSLYTELSDASTIHNELNAEYRRLQQERQNLMTPVRIEQRAQAELSMRPASPGVTVYLPRDAGELMDDAPQRPAQVQLLDGEGTQ